METYGGIMRVFVCPYCHCTIDGMLTGPRQTESYNFRRHKHVCARKSAKEREYFKTNGRWRSQ